MSTASRFVYSVAALGMLLAGVASATTPLAQMPLKASVLAKPNVIFGMDDSGSMDWEILLDTDSGLLWWNGSTAWDSANGRPLRSSSRPAYAYLFPVGTGAGGALYTGSWHALPPTPQFAWARSRAFNPLYYDTMQTYAPWSPAHFGGSLRTYADANPSAALIHPAAAGATTLAVNAQWNSGHANFQSSGFRFYVQSGMQLPPGTVVASSSAGSGGTPCGGSTRTLTATQTVGSSACHASIPYYPATFWHPQACTLGTDCVSAPDGSGTLKRYEIRSTTTTYPSGRTYAQEMQNFANWFSYYRKRKLMLAASMGRVLEDMSGLRLGVMPFNSSATPTIYDADHPSASSNRFAAAGHFYLNAMSANGTPTHQAVKNIAAQFQSNTSIVQYACQRNNMFIVTDGFSNTTSTSVPAYSKATWGSGAPYATTHNGTLADLALAYYTLRLRPDLPAGRVPPSASTAPSADLNTDLHINTYGITLGVRGSLWPANTDPYASPPTWTVPVADDPSMIDDQWHATINGRGRMYLATTPDETAASLRAGLEDMISQVSTQGGMAVGTVNLGRSDSRAYRSVYDPAGWTGDVQAVVVNRDDATVAAAPTWSAAAQLDARAWSTRVIATASGSFSAGNATVTAQVNPGNAWGSNADVMNYLRGDRSREGTAFRVRRSLMGSPINAEPAVDRTTGVVYAATGEGMLHAFDIQGGDAGKELWAFVPSAVLPHIGQTTARSYGFRPRLDGTPVVRGVGNGNRLLVAGMGPAGRGYYALDVTSPRGLTEAGLAGKVKWEFPAAGDSTMQAKVGQTVGRPVIVKLGGGGGYAVVLTSGYNNTHDGKGRLWVLDADNGSVLKEFVTPDGTLSAEAGLAHVSAFAEPDGSVRYVYGGDLLGNLWRFDLAQPSGSSAAVHRLAQLKGPTGIAQPVTAAPELLAHLGKRIVYIGTGRLLDSSDFGSTRVQTVYAIADGSTLSNPRGSLVQQVLNVSGSGSLTANAVDWAVHRGWYVDLPAGEQANTQPVLAYGALSVVANKTGSSDCSASSRLYVMDVLTGSRFSGISYVSWTISDSSNASAPIALLGRDGKVRVVTLKHEGAQAMSREVAGSGIVPAGKNAWREVRR